MHSAYYLNYMVAFSGMSALAIVFLTKNVQATTMAELWNMGIQEANRNCIDISKQELNAIEQADVGLGIVCPCNTIKTTTPELLRWVILNFGIMITPHNTPIGFTHIESNVTDINRADLELERVQSQAFIDNPDAQLSWVEGLLFIEATEKAMKPGLYTSLRGYEVNITEQTSMYLHPMAGDTLIDSVASFKRTVCSVMLTS